MKNNKSLLICMLLMLIVFSGCSVITGIFKAGVWVGVLVVVLIIGGILWIVSRMGK